MSAKGCASLTIDGNWQWQTAANFDVSPYWGEKGLMTPKYVFIYFTTYLIYTYCIALTPCESHAWPYTQPNDRWLQSKYNNLKSIDIACLPYFLTMHNHSHTNWKTVLYSPHPAISYLQTYNYSSFTLILLSIITHPLLMPLVIMYSDHGHISS